jgi:hypothetical protein
MRRRVLQAPTAASLAAQLLLLLQPPHLSSSAARLSVQGQFHRLHLGGGYVYVGQGVHCQK